MKIRDCALRSIIPQAATIYTIYVRFKSEERISLGASERGPFLLTTEVLFFSRGLHCFVHSVFHSLYTRKRLDVSTHSSSSSTGATIAGLAVEPPGASRYNSVVSGSAFSTIT